MALPVCISFDETLNCPTLAGRRKDICLKTIKQLLQEGHLSSHLPLPRRNTHAYNIARTMFLAIVNLLKSEYQ